MNDHPQEEAERIRRDEGDLRVALVLLDPDSNGTAVTYFAGLTSMASASVRRTTISSPFLTSFNRFTLSSTFKVTVFCCGPRKVTVRVLIDSVNHSGHLTGLHSDAPRACSLGRHLHG